VIFNFIAHPATWLIMLYGIQESRLDFVIIGAVAGVIFRRIEGRGK
jgi:hypothetical protein